MIVHADSLEKLASEARERCKDGQVLGLLLSADIGFASLDSLFLASHESTAREWQEPTTPAGLYINHGYYIHRTGDGIAYLAKELRTKFDSRRACLSLISMSDLLPSKDDPVPSFLVLQVMFTSSARDCLQISGYFRALEVARFLPINLAEIGLIAKTLHSQFPTIEQMRVRLFAAAAYSKEDFNCLRKASLDSEPAWSIGVAIAKREFEKIRGWIDSKIAVSESVADTSGLTTLVEAIRGVAEPPYPAELLRSLEEALKCQLTLKAMREASSSTPELERMAANVRRHLEAAKDNLPKA